MKSIAKIQTSGRKDNAVGIHHGVTNGSQFALSGQTETSLDAWLDLKHLDLRDLPLQCEAETGVR